MVNEVLIRVYAGISAGYTRIKYSHNHKYSQFLQNYKKELDEITLGIFNISNTLSTPHSRPGPYDPVSYHQVVGQFPMNTRDRPVSTPSAYG